MKVEYLGILLILGIIRGGKGRKCYKQHGNGLSYIDCDETNSNCSWKSNNTDFDNQAWSTVCYTENIANSCLSTSWILVECQQEPEETSQVNLCCCNEISCGLKKLQNREKRQIDPQDFKRLESKVNTLKFEVIDVHNLVLKASAETKAISEGISKLAENSAKATEALKADIQSSTSSLNAKLDANSVMMDKKLSDTNDMMNGRFDNLNTTMMANYESLKISINDVMFIASLSAIGIIVAGVSLIINIILIIILCVCMRKKKAKKEKKNQTKNQTNETEEFAAVKKQSSEYIIGGPGSTVGSSYMKVKEEKKTKEEKTKGEKTKGEKKDKKKKGKK